MPFNSPPLIGASNLAVNGDAQVCQNGQIATVFALSAVNRATRLGMVPSADNWPYIYDNQPTISIQSSQWGDHPIISNGSCARTLIFAGNALAGNGYFGHMCGIPLVNIQAIQPYTANTLNYNCSFWFKSTVRGTYTAFLAFRDDLATLNFYPVPFLYDNVNVWKRVLFTTPPIAALGASYLKGGIGVMYGGAGAIRDNTKMNIWNTGLTPFVSESQINVNQTAGADMRITDAFVAPFNLSVLNFPRKTLQDNLQSCRALMYSSAPYGYADKPRNLDAAVGLDSGFALISAGAGGYAFGTLDVRAISDNYRLGFSVRGITFDNPYANNGFGRNVSNGVDTIGAPILRGNLGNGLPKSLEILTVCDATSTFGDCILLNVTIDANIDILS